MKKLLFALALFSIMPICAMEKEIKEEKPIEQLRDADSQFALDQELHDTIWQSPSSPSAINSLLARGANPNNAFIRTSHLDMKVEQSSKLRALLDSGFNMLAMDEFRETIFHKLALLKAPQILALFLLHAQERGLDLKKIALQKDPRGATPLSRANYFSFFSNKDDSKNKVLILTDPNKYISQFFPELIEQVQQEQIAAKLKKASTPSLYSYLRNREIGRKR